MNQKFLAILLVGALVASGCGQGEKQAAQGTETQTASTQTQTGTTSQKEAVGTLMGVGLSPKSFEASDFSGFFEKAKQAGEIVSWAGDWQELSNTQGGGPTVTVSLSQTYKYTPVILAQFFEQSSGKLLRPLDENTKKAYKNSAVEFAKKYKPKYLGFGIEVNTLFEKSRTDFEAFAEFYNETYDAVKAVSPNTKIFTVYQLEKMKGLNGGLFGVENNLKNSQWALLEKFDADITAFTTYPGLIYKNPSEIPKDYYSEIKNHTNKPVAFTETGWHTKAEPTGWESSETEQAEFVTAFFNLTKSMEPEFAIWSFLYDQDTKKPFDSMGLYSRDGTAKQAWEKWLNEK